MFERAACAVCGRDVEVVDPHLMPQTPGVAEGAVFGTRLLCKDCATGRHHAHRQSG